MTRQQFKINVNCYDFDDGERERERERGVSVTVGRRGEGASGHMNGLLQHERRKRVRESTAATEAKAAGLKAQTEQTGSDSERGERERVFAERLDILVATQQRIRNLDRTTTDHFFWPSSLPFAPLLLLFLPRPKCKFVKAERAESFCSLSPTKVDTRDLNGRRCRGVWRAVNAKIEIYSGQA